MNFLAPWAFGFAALAPVIVLLYLIRLQRRSVRVSTLLFWERVLDQNRRSAPFRQKLRNLLSLLLHLLIFALILLALAKPVLDRILHAGASTILVLDTRARMQAIESDGRSRFDAALATAREIVSQAGPSREIAVVLAGGETRVLVPFSSDEKILRDRLANLEASDAGGDLSEGLALAESVLESRAGERRMIVLTDRKEISWAPHSTGMELNVRGFGTARDNVGITRFAAQSLPADPATAEVLLQVRNFGRDAFAGNAELSLGGKLIDVRPFHLKSGESSTVLFPAIAISSRSEAAQPSVLAAKLDKPDALACDNVAYALLPVLEKVNVLQVTEGNWFLEKLLSTDTRAKYELIAPTSFRLEMAAQFDAVLFDKFVPPGLTLQSLTGNTLFVRDSPLAAAARNLEQPLVSDFDEAHPVLRNVSLRNVTIAKAAAVTLPAETAGWRFSAPLRSFDHPLLITGTRTTEGKAQRVAVLPFDLTDSDLPLRVAFPMMIGNLVQWLGGRPGESSDRLRAGETRAYDEQIIIAGPNGGAQQRLTETTAPPLEIQSEHVFHPLRNGVYAIRHAGYAQSIAVNTFDESESDLTISGDSSSSSVPQNPAWLSVLPAFGGLPLWRYLALAACALLSIEWWLFHRRRTE